MHRTRAQCLLGGSILCAFVAVALWPLANTIFAFAASTAIIGTAAVLMVIPRCGGGCCQECCDSSSSSQEQRRPPAPSHHANDGAEKLLGAHNNTGRLLHDGAAPAAKKDIAPEMPSDAVCAKLAAVGGQPPQQSVNTAVTLGREASRRPRTYFLDNLKVLLTVIVVNHHAMLAPGGVGGWYLKYGAGPLTSFTAFAAAITSLNQAYFMACFFFISGFFVPNSFDKSTPRAFLRSKFHRLGLPFLAFLFIFGPLLNLLAAYTTGNRFSYFPSPGPPWFLAWLLFFCCA
jgi:hypothetical protein